MAATSLAQVQSLDDILDQTRFVLRLGTLPGGADSEKMSIKCFNATIPGISNEAFETHMGGHVRKFRGRKMYPRILSASFYEDVKSDTLTKLHIWNEIVVGTDSGDSDGYIDNYSSTVELEVYDTAGVLSAIYRMYRFFPVDVPDVNLTSESSAPVQVQVQFSYDYFISSNFSTR